MLPTLSPVEETAVVRFDPQARAFEAFSLRDYSRLLDPLDAATLNEALAEITARWSWNRGDRLGVRELGKGKDVLHVYAIRQQSHGRRVWNGHIPATEHRRWLDPICTVDLNVVAGIGVHLLGNEVQLHERRQDERPDGARLERRK